VYDAAIISDRNLRGAHNWERDARHRHPLYQTETCAVLTTDVIQG